MSDLKIVYRNYGIADRFPNGIIEMNKHLDDYPNLKKSLLLHEASHTNKKEFNRKDFMHDLTSINQFSTFDMMRFMVRHPLSMVQVLPIYWTKTGGWVWDEVASIYWGILTITIISALVVGFVL